MDEYLKQSNTVSFLLGIIIASVVFMYILDQRENDGYNTGVSTGFYRCLKGISENKEMIPSKTDVQKFLDANPGIKTGPDLN